MATASAIAVESGLDRVTAKAVAVALGVFPGLVSYYFHSADDLVAAAFGAAASAEREDIYARVETGGTPTERLRILLTAYVEPDRDAISLLWLDAWQASRRRPALRTEVAGQMLADVERLAGLIRTGISTGEFATLNPETAAVRVLALLDGLSVQAAIRSSFDYTDVQTLLIRDTERELDITEGTLLPGKFSGA